MTEETPVPEGLDAIWLPISTAPKDGKAINLLIASAGREHALRDTNDPTETVGFWFEGDEGGGKWQFAGWDWCNDIFVDGEGEPIMWAPIPLASATADMERERDDWKRLHDEEQARAERLVNDHTAAAHKVGALTEQVADLERRLAEAEARATAAEAEAFRDKEAGAIIREAAALLSARAPVEARLADLTERKAALEAALEAIRPFIPIGYASAGRPGSTEDRNVALDAARALVDAVLSLPSLRSSGEVGT